MPNNKLAHPLGFASPFWKILDPPLITHIDKHKTDSIEYSLIPVIVWKFWPDGRGKLLLYLNNIFPKYCMKLKEF